VGLRGAREAVGFLPDALRELVEQEGSAISRGLCLGAGGEASQHCGEEWVEIFSGHKTSRNASYYRYGP